MIADVVPGAYALAFGLSLCGGFCLLGALAMTMRRGIARDIRTPITDDPSVDPVTRLARSMMRFERASIPAYTFIIRFFLFLGVALISAAAVAALVTWL